MRRALKLVSQGADTVYKRPLSIPEHYNLRFWSIFRRLFDQDVWDRFDIVTVRFALVHKFSIEPVHLATLFL